MRPMVPSGIVMFAFLSTVPGVYAEEVVIPAVNIPARVVPGYTIPGYTIPAQRTPYGTLPAIVVPAIVVPDIYVPAVNTNRVVIDLPEYHLISREEIVDYARQTPKPAPEPAPVRLTYEPMNAADRKQAFAAYDRRASQAPLGARDRDGEVTLRDTPGVPVVLAVGGADNARG